MAKRWYDSIQILTACTPERQACPCTHFPLPHGTHTALGASTCRDTECDCCAYGCADWPSVDAYYYGSSSSHSIPNVKIPLLCIQASQCVCVGYGQLLMACRMPICCLQEWTCVLVCTHLATQMDDACLAVSQDTTLAL